MLPVVQALELVHRPTTGIGGGATVWAAVGAAVGAVGEWSFGTGGAHRNRTFQSLQPPELSLLRHTSPLALHVTFVSNGVATAALRRHSA